MLHRAFLDGDGTPDFFRILPLLRQQPFQMRVAHIEAARERLVGIAVGGGRLDPRAGAAADDGDGGRRRNRRLVGEALLETIVRSIRAGAAGFRQRLGGSVHALLDMGEYLAVPDLRHDRFQRHALGLQEGMKAHNAEADAALARRGVFRPFHFVRRAVDEILQHIVEEQHHVLDKAVLPFPFVIFFKVERGQAADRRPLLAEMINARRQGDFRAEV